MAAGFSLNFNASEEMPLENYPKPAIQSHKGSAHFGAGFPLILGLDTYQKTCPKCEFSMAFLTCTDTTLTTP
jgi:hypothetical protein